MSSLMRRAGGVALLLAAVAGAPRADQPASPARHQPAAVLHSETCTLLRREAKDQPWHIVKQNEKLRTGDLLVGGREAVLDSLNGAVRLEMLGDMNGQTPFPVIETAIVLHPAKDVDLDLTMDRGRLDLTNRKEKGPARVRVHIRDRVGVLTLKEPGARVALELFGRWPAGEPFVKDPKPGYGPPLAFAFLVLQGEVELQSGDGQHQLLLKAPPGPALLLGDSISSFDRVPQRLEKLPPWADETPLTEREKRIKEVLAKFRKLAIETSPTDAIDTLAKSKDPAERHCALLMMGALDDLPHLGATLSNTSDPADWDTAVRVLRHWIGRGPGQDQMLYKGLIEKRGFKPVEAEAVLQLLHSFSEEELSQPELYGALIHFLNHDKMAIRGLAHWHLVRLVPGGDKIPYDLHAAPAERAKAVSAWLKLVPTGQLPKRGAPEPKPEK
jgi:hypothetical protein